MFGAVPLLLLLLYTGLLSLSHSASVDLDAGLSRSERFEMLKTIAKVPLKGWNSFDGFLVRLTAAQLLMCCAGSGKQPR
jgi:hypothetical protein